ncbi:MAG: hypothetical protein JWO47_686 [Candidatus Saccharibacteria bacterium]|nr:hypothetical protein [Candidatus Saccharibacteria bacterium]
MVDPEITGAVEPWQESADRDYPGYDGGFVGHEAIKNYYNALALDIVTANIKNYFQVTGSYAEANGVVTHEDLAAGYAALIVSIAESAALSAQAEDTKNGGNARLRLMIDMKQDLIDAEAKKKAAAAKADELKEAIRRINEDSILRQAAVITASRAEIVEVTE